MKADRRFTFRGDRKYLQSASLFDDLIAFRERQAQDIDFRFSRKTAQQVAYQDAPPGDPAATVATWTDRGGRLFVVERNEPIDTATPYDEPELVARIRFEGRSAHVPADIGPFSRIEALVAAFKHLLLGVYAGVQRKYVFVRIRLDHVPQQDCTVTYARDIGEFFQGDITEGDRRIGQIFFGVWK